VVNDSSYLAAALGVFLLAAGVQLGLYFSLLRRALESGDALRMRSAFVRWIAVDVVWQAVVLVAGYAYFAAGARAHNAGVAWIFPGVAAIIGTALPLQLVAMAALRAARR
jgi:hypothetical protein